MKHLKFMINQMYVVPSFFELLMCLNKIHVNANTTNITNKFCYMQVMLDDHGL